MLPQALKHRKLNSGWSWLEPGVAEREPSLAWSGFSHVEEESGRRWVWSLGSESSVSCGGGAVYYTLVAPIIATFVAVSVGGHSLRTHHSSRAWQEFSGKAEVPPGAELVFQLSYQNESGDGFRPGDDRPLGLLFKHLRFVPASDEPAPVKSRKVCPYPFSKMEVYSPNFAPCCTWWLEEDLSFEGSDGEAWNSGAAQALRASVLDGSYRFCKLDVCEGPLLEMNELERSADFDLPIAPENLLALRAGKTEMPVGPASVVVLADPRCNLACPSCRKQQITELTAQESAQLKETERLLLAYGGSIRNIVLASNGEVFYSPFLRGQLKEATRIRFPMLSHIEIISNGILFDEKTYSQLLPGSESIRRVGLSMDAGNELVYRAVRGGDWSRLMKNLEWLSGMRASGRLDNLRLNFVLRKENLSSLREFFTLAAASGVDEVFISQVLPWSEASIDFHDQNIFRADHPLNGQARHLWRELTGKKLPFRVLGNVERALA